MCGQAIAANDAVYINSADGKIYKYDPLQPLQVYAGIAKEAGLLNAFIRVVQSGRVKGFSGLTPGAFVYASVTVPGGFQLTDPGSSLKVVLGIAKSATELTVNGALGIKTGGGTGSGGINYILNPDADTTVGWATYADAGGVTPVDGTGGSPTVTFTRSTSSPLRGTASFLLTKPASNVQGQGFSYDFTIDPADCGKVLQGSFDYQIASGTFADDAMSVWIYDITNARMIQPAPYLLKNSGIIERFPLEFQTAIDSTSYRLIVHQASTSAVACTIKFDNFNFGPQAKLYGSAVTDWVSYTPTWSSSGTQPSIGNGTLIGKWRKVGDSIEASIYLQFGSTSSKGTGSYLLSLPSGMTIDTQKIPAGVFQSLGHGHYLSQVSTTAAQVQDVVVASSTAVQCVSDQNVTSNVFSSTQTNVFNTTNDNWSITFKVPIQGWSSSQIMSSDADTRVVAARGSQSTSTQVFTSGAGAVGIGLNAGQFDTHNALSTNSTFTAPVSGIYSFSASIMWANSAWPVGAISQLGVVKTFIGGATAFVNLDRYTNEAAGTFFVNLKGSDKIDLKAGESIQLVANHARGANTSLHNDAAFNYFSIDRVSGPAQIAASESVSALYTGAPPTIAGGTIDGTERIVTFGTRVKDSHNSYSGGLYTVPSSGVYDISSSTGVSGTFTAGSYATMTIEIDGVETYTSVYLGNASSPGLFPTINIKSIPLRAGQTVSIKLGTQSVTSPVFNTSASVNYFSLTRSGNY